MRVAMDAVIATDKICEAAICYTGDLFDPDRAKYDLKYYVSMAKELRDAGAHVLGLKDMAGLLKPAAAYALVKALKEEVGLPVHFHTHDTSGVAAASILAAVARRGRCGRRGDGLLLRRHLAALPRLDRRGAAPHRARHRARHRGDPGDLRLLGGGARAVRRLRGRAEGAGVGGLPARDAGRAVHQPQGAGPLDGPRGALARGGADVRRGEPDVRRHRQGHAVLEGGRRHGADDGGAGADPGAGRGPGGRGGLPRQRRRHDARQPRPAAGRLAGGAAEEGAEGRDAADRPARRGDAAGRPRQGCAPSSRRRPARRASTTRTSADT